MTLPDAGWRISCDDAVDLMVSLGDDLRSLQLPRLSPAPPPTASADAVAQWRREADVTLRDALSVARGRARRGEDRVRAAQRAAETVMRWSRRSLRALASEAGAGGFGAYLRQGEARLWDRMADAVARRGDLDDLERLLQAYIEMAYEAAAGGFASLIAGGESR